jgi:hypothetical protein
MPPSTSCARRSTRISPNVNAVALVLVVVLLAGIAIGAYALLAPRRVPTTARERAEGMQATTEWTSEAGEEFAGLSDNARCELVFAVAALDDERSQRLLEHALGDPAEAVCLAAAHALASSGRRGLVDRFLAEHPGARADRIAQTLSLLE